MTKHELPIEGMTCEHCAQTVQAALAGVPGVRAANVDFSKRRAVVEVEDGRAQVEDLATAVAAAGYRVGRTAESPVNLIQLSPVTVPAPSGNQSPAKPAAPDRLTDSQPTEQQRTEHLLLDIEGMHCASCIGRVEGGLAAVPGVVSARANLATDQAAVEFDPTRASLDQLIAAVERTGYKARLPSPTDQPGAELTARGTREVAQWRRRLATSLALLAPIVALHYWGHLLPWAGYVQAVAATALQVFIGWPFYVGAWQRLRRGGTSMDTLVAIGTTAAYVGGLGELASGHPSMAFVDAGIILTFITLGKYLEAASKGRASAAIRKLLDLTPPVATVVRNDRAMTVSPREVAPGETLIIKPGEKVPLDAEVVSGTSTVNQAWLTGESLPVDKGPGDEILAGTINGSGALTARVSRPADKTALAQVIELVRRAQESKTDIQRVADRVVSWFVPAVLLLATGTLVAWGLAGDRSMAYSATIAVLVVACPCALGLATPTAILVASGRGAELGILIKQAHSLEVAGGLTTVVLDKTGTITLGEPHMTGVHPASGITEERLLAIAAAAERLSGHPLAKPIVVAAEARNLPIPAASMEIVPGAGLRAASDAGEIRVGNPQLLDAARIDWSSQRALVDQLRSAGQSVLFVALDREFLGVIAVADPVAPHSREAVEMLKTQGLEVLMVTGDHEATAQAISSQVGIDTVRAGILPGEKQAIVAELRSRGRVVAMVGDGINDAPALAAADLGIAMGSGSEIAIEAADVVIVGHDLRAVARTVALGRATLRTIRQNLAWAFLYNVLLLPLAAGALAPLAGVRLGATAAAAAMAASSVSVVTNSLLLRRRAAQ